MHLLGARTVTGYFIKEVLYTRIQKGGCMDQIWSVIGQYAFPIVACVVMGWYVKYIQDNYKNDDMSLIKKTAKYKRGDE